MNESIIRTDIDTLILIVDYSTYVISPYPTVVNITVEKYIESIIDHFVFNKKEYPIIPIDI